MAVAAIVGAGLFAGMETGVYLLNRVRLAVRAGRGERAALRLRRELSDPNRTLSSLLIGTNMCSYAGSFGLAQLLHGLGFDGWALVTLEAAVFTPLLFIFAETLPKDLFRTHTDRWTYTLSGPFVLSRWLFTVTGLLPVVQTVGQLVSRLIGGSVQGTTTARERISRLIKEGVRTGVISEAQTTLADRALAMRGLTVETEMIPWRSAVTIPLSADRRQRETLIRRRDFTRVPVVDESGRVVGVLSSIDALLRRDEPTAALVSTPMTVPVTSPVRDALRTMRRNRQAMAIAVDPDSGAPRGLVTLKDLVETITGELAAW
jgi:CBS domain containing-hemolysin-like protein